MLLAALVATPAGAQDLQAIMKGQSASAVLNKWCSAHALPALIARRTPGAVKLADLSARAALAARPGERVRYRRVTLSCGARVISHADNWYLPARLTADMNRRLDTTEAPFGLVVAPLRFHRITLSARGGRVRAVLQKPDGTPFSYVVEDYAALERRP